MVSITIVEDGSDIPKKRYYVTMTDKFLSGWGHSKGRINKLVIGTNDYQLARTIAKNGRERSEMRFVNIRSSKPYYDKRTHTISYKDAEDLGRIWKK